MSDLARQAAAEAALALVRDGMVLGLGTGSTMEFVLRGIAARGLLVRGVPTSEQTAARARALGIMLEELGGITLDLAIDGADEVAARSLDLVKGLGGALLREKIVAASAARFVVVADRAKLVGRLGSRVALPVEVACFGHKATSRRLEALGCAPALRGGAAAIVTDNGNFIYDCRFPPITDAAALAGALDDIPGVLGHGLFLGMADDAFLADADGKVEHLRR